MGVHTQLIGAKHTAWPALSVALILIVIALPASFGAADTGDPAAVREDAAAGVPEKFDGPLYEKVQNLALRQSDDNRRGAVQYYDIVIVVARHDAGGNDIADGQKGLVVAELKRVGAVNIRAAESLIFVTASVPVGEILGLSLHGEVHAIGDGQTAISPDIDTARQTINAAPGDIRHSGRTPDGSGVTVAVIEVNGINHTDVNDQLIKSFHCTGSGCVGGAGTTNPAHPSTVALILGGNRTSHGGIAPGVNFLSFSMFSSAAMYHALDQAVKEGAKVANLSISFSGGGMAIACDYSRHTNQLIMDDAVNNGLVVLGSSGNAAGSGETPVYGSVTEPCSGNMITVGGIDDRTATTRMYGSSGRGPSTSIPGPVLKPEIVAPAVNITDLLMPGYLSTGTSFATPMVSAAAAILIGENASLGPAEVKAALLLGANWTGPVPCTSVQYEQNNTADGCSHARQPDDTAGANGSLDILNNVGFGILDVGKSLGYARSGNHVVNGTIGEGESHEYAFSVADTEETVKTILTWRNPSPATLTANGTDVYYAPAPRPNLDLEVRCPGAEAVDAGSVAQINEFAVFEPSQTGACSVVVRGTDMNGTQNAQYVLASTRQISRSAVGPAFSSATLDRDTGVLVIAFDETIDASGIDPGKFHIREPGASAGGTTLSAAELGTTADSATVSFTLTEANLAAVNALAAPDLTIDSLAVRDPSGNGFGPVFDVSAASFVDAFSVSSQDTVPTGVAFSPGGTKMFVTGDIGEDVNEYALAAAFDVSTASFVDAFSVGSEDDGPTGVAFSPGGTRMFVTGSIGSDVNEYALGTAFDVSTASFTHAFPVSSQEILPTGVAFSADGTRMFVVGLTGSGVNEYALTAAFDVSTASFTHAFSVASQDSSPGDVTFSADGTRMFVTGDIGDDVNEYALTAAFDVSTASFTDSFSVRSEDNSPTGVAFSSDGTRMFVVGSQNDSVYEYALGLTFGIALTGTPPDTTPPDTTDAFITTWNTDDPYQAVTFPGTGAYHIDWGDGTTENATGAATHTYATAGSHTVSVSGGLEWFSLGNAADSYNAYRLRSIDQWGDIRWTSMEGAFRSATEMVYNAHDVPDLSNVTSMRSMFYSANDFDGDLSSWNVSSVTDMGHMFDDAYAFNSNLSGWNVSSVTDMRFMFDGAGVFNGDVSGWDVSSVTDMGHMFYGARAFNQTLNDWNVSSVTDMSYMLGAASFNHPLDSWDVSSVTDMYRMFNSASSFNQPLDSWDVSSVTNMRSMFSFARAFNQPLDLWNVSSVTNMINMFSYATAFNQPLDSWDVSSVTDMGGMFGNAAAFNQPLDLWNVSSVTIMGGMFSSSAFNQTLSDWDVSSVTNMASMFSGATSFNQPLDSWDVSSVTDMEEMFLGADAFNQNLGNWYIVPDSTEIARANVPGTVGGISAQNDPLDGHSPAYGIGPGGDSGFAISGNLLSMTYVAAGKGDYAVNITAAGTSVFEDGNNWRMVNVTVTGDTTPPAFSSATLDRGTGALEIAFDETIDATNIDAARFHIREPGTPAGGTTLSAAELGTTADSATISFTLTAANLAAVNALAAPELTIDPSAVRDISGNGFGPVFAVSTASFVDAFSVASQDGFPTGVAFSPDGTKMFVTGFFGEDVNEYALGTAFDVSTASFVDAFSVSSQETRPQGVAFSPDGTKMFVMGGRGDDVNEYALGAAFDVSTASFVDAFSVRSEDDAPTGVAFSADGAKMFVVGFAGDDVSEYALAAAFDVSTASFVDAFSVSIRGGTNPDGRRVLRRRHEDVRDGSRNGHDVIRVRAGRGL